jgi:hypothetical protein
MSHDNSSYFSFIATGVAYVNRVKQILPQEGGRVFAPYWTAQLAVLVSERNAVQYRYIDCTVQAEEAVKLICLYSAEANDPKSKVLCGFRISNLRAEAFTRNNGDVGTSLKGRLIKVNWLKVNNRKVYTDEPVTAQ